MYKIRGITQYSSIEQNVYSYSEAKERYLQYIDSDCTQVVINEYSMTSGEFGKVLDYYNANMMGQICQAQ